MRRVKGTLENQKGYVLVAAAMIALVVSGLALVGMQNSTRNLSANQNLVSRNMAFYAADGVITSVVQDIVDGNHEKYLLSRGLSTTTTVGSVSPAGYYQYTGSFRDTVKAAGSGIGGGQDGGFYFAHTTLDGDIDIKVKIVSFSGAVAAGRAGIMLRTDGTQGSRFYFSGITTAGRPYALRRTTTAGATSAESLSVVTLPRWIRLTRTDSLRTFHSADGKSWTRVGRGRAVTLGTTVMAGLVVTSASNGTTATAVFDSLNLGRGRGSFTLDNVTVFFTMDKAQEGGYDLAATASKLDAQGKPLFSVPLKQHFTPENMYSLPSYPDHGFLHFVAYDYKSDGTNPNFWSCQTEYIPPGIPDSTLTPDRKPRLRNDYARHLWQADYGPRVHKWWALCTDQVWFEWPNDPAKNQWMKKCCVNLVNRWFRVSATDTSDTTVRFMQDPNDHSKWRWKTANGGELDYRGDRFAYRSWHYDDFDPMANYIIYDSLRMDRITSGIWSAPAASWGYKHSSAYFNPTDGKGFGAQQTHRMGTNSCIPAGAREKCTRANHHHPATTQNYCFAFEIHTRFKYRASDNQFFWANADDGGSHWDCWLFVNDKLVFDAADPSNSIWLNDMAAACGLVDGNTYAFDLFITSREGQGVELELETNYDLFSPAGAERRAWRRDYGRLN